MLEILQFIFSSFWVFCGFFLLFAMTLSLIGGTLTVTFRILNRLIRHRNIALHGYPPPHCDADGDFKVEALPK